MATSQTLKNVILVGAGGDLGTPVLEHLIASNAFNVSILTRTSSKSTFPASVSVHRVPDDYPLSDLVTAFQKQDAVVMTIGTLQAEQSYRFIDAAIQAGVKRFIPSEFGPNNRNKNTQEMIPVSGLKAQIVEYLKTKEAPEFSWTAICTGSFITWALRNTFLNINIPARTARLWDSGTQKFSCSTFPTIARSIAQTLLQPAVSANKYLYLGDFTVSQRDIVAELEAQAGAKWTLTHADSTQLLKDAKEAVAKGEDPYAQYDLIRASVFVEGFENDFEKVDGDSGMDILGLERATLGDVVKEVLADEGKL